MSAGAPPGPQQVLRDSFDEAVALGRDPEAPRPAPPSIAATRRRRLRPAEFDGSVLRVVDIDGVLFLEDGAELVQAGARRRGRGSPTQVGGDVVYEVAFEHLPRNQIQRAIQALDDKLTPDQGLRSLKGGEKGKLVPGAKLSADGRILLLIHGTFSSGDHLVDELRATPAGGQLLRRAENHYDQILSFDHATLSKSPILNARELATLLSGSKADVDVVCHSRGGLVARWWVEAMDGRARQRRVVFVGSPLAGTALAAPPNLRASLSLLTNIGHALAGTAGMVAAAQPFLWVAAKLFEVFSSVTSLAARTPAVDAAIALVPGLAAMSRVGNNLEIQALRRHQLDGVNYHCIQANFEPTSPGWKFWKVFRNPKERVADLLSDAVFDGENDLVVDTIAMAELTEKLRIPSLFDFRTTDTVHHTNYFRQPETLGFIAESLRLR